MARVNGLRGEAGEDRGGRTAVIPELARNDLAAAAFLGALYAIKS